MEWKRQQIPLLDALMDELCHSQKALVSRDLASLHDSVHRQIALAAEIAAANRRLLEPDLAEGSVLTGVAPSPLAINSDLSAEIGQVPVL